MNSIERIQTVMSGGIPDRIPVMTHNFLMAAKEAGVTMEQYRSDPDVIANTLIDACIKYGTDGILLDVDTALLASACGADVVYPKDLAAITKDFQPRSISQIIDDLQKVDLRNSDRVKIYLEAIHKLSIWCNENQIFLRANADQGPFSLGCLLVGMNDFLCLLLDDEEEENILALMEQTTKIALQMHRLCYEAGGHCTSYGNSSSGCSVVSPDIFRRFAKPFEIELHKQLKSDGIPTICHICGWTDPMQADLAEIGCPMYEFDSRTDIRIARDTGKGHYVLSGNLDPTLLCKGSAEEVRAAARDLLDMFRGKGGLMIGPGCALPAETSSENIHVLVEMTKKYG